MFVCVRRVMPYVRRRKKFLYFDRTQCDTHFAWLYRIKDAESQIHLRTHCLSSFDFESYTNLNFHLALSTSFKCCCLNTCLLARNHWGAVTPRSNTHDSWIYSFSFALRLLVCRCMSTIESDWYYHIHFNKPTTPLSLLFYARWLVFHLLIENWMQLV